MWTALLGSQRGEPEPPMSIWQGTKAKLGDNHQNSADSDRHQHPARDSLDSASMGVAGVQATSGIAGSAWRCLDVQADPRYGASEARKAGLRGRCRDFGRDTPIRGLTAPVLEQPLNRPATGPPQRRPPG